MQYEAIGFDLGGVIIGTATEFFMRHVAGELGVTPAELVQPLEELRQPLERGEITPAEFWQQLTSKLGVEYEADKDLRLWTEHFVGETPIRREMLSLADRLKENGYRLGMLSNTTVQHVALNRERHIFDHFDVALMSNEIGTRKPEPEAYRLLAERLGTQPEKMVFIDDLPENIAGAEATGVTGILFEGYAPLIRQLRELGVRV